MDLHAITRGGGEALLLLHGFTTGARAWDEPATALAERFQVVTPDLLGHGASPAPDAVEPYQMRRCVADLVALLDRLGIADTHCLGYSMGGRVALALALAKPRRIRSLTLESASPGIADADERRRRRKRDEALAARLERDGVAAFVDEWMAQPLFATQRALPAEKLAATGALRLANSIHGLANSLRGLGTGSQPSFWNDLPNLTMPTLLIAGEHDAKFRAIAASMANLIANARLAFIPNAGHTTHLEQTAEFLRTVTSFLADISSPSPRRHRAHGGFTE